jgi:biopolymer transport protein ExbD
MKFPRHARLLRSQLDFAPFASVFFLLVIFLLLGPLLSTPGIRIDLPVADNLTGTDKPTLTVALDANGRVYFQSQLIDEGSLKTRLAGAVTNSAEPLTLVVQADKAVTQENLERLLALARAAGIQEALLARLPRAGVAPARKSIAP